jgi:pentafunctional AROM polypeptide
MENMKIDKKNKNGQYHVVGVTALGETVDIPSKTVPVPEEIMRQVLSPSVSVRWQGPGGIMGNVRLPGSKSVSNRALLLAALSKGNCTVTNLTPSEDIRVMLQALSGLVKLTYPTSTSEGIDVNVSGLGVSTATSALPLAADASKTIHVWVENAGTVARFLTPALALLFCAADASKVEALELDGNRHMRKRPIGDLVACMAEALPAVQCDYVLKDNFLPLRFTRKKTAWSSGGLAAAFPGGRLSINNKVSSQFVSAMLLVAPLAATPVELHLQHMQTDQKTGVVKAVSQPYIDMTVAMMASFGIKVERPAPDTYRIPTGQYVAPSTYAVEADASAASYPLALAAITNGRVSVNVPTLSAEPLQGDTKFVGLLEQMGCAVERDETTTTVSGPPSGKLKGVAVDMGDMTDTFMTAAALMAYAAAQGGGESTISNVENQRVKECNRIDAMQANLAATGAEVEAVQDGLVIRPPKEADRHAVALSDSKSDHRLAMSMAVYGCVRPNIVIGEWRCVEKTFSDFWDILRKLKVEVRGSADAPESDAEAPTVFLVGMRNCGKSKLGRASARALGVPFVDADELLQAKIGDLGAYVAAHGWPAFRTAELAVLKSLAGTKGVVALGGGVGRLRC